MPKQKKNTKSKKQAKRSSVKTNKDILILGILVLSLVYAISIYTNLAGSLSHFSQKYIYGILGVGAYILPIYTIYIMLEKIFSECKENSKKRILGVSIIALTVILFSSVLYTKLNSKLPYDLLWKRIISFNAESYHGGILGQIIAYPLIKLIGFISSYIVCFSSIVISIVYMIDIKLENIALAIKKKLKNMYTSSANKNTKKAKDKSPSNKEETNNKVETLVNIEEDTESRIIDIIVKDDNKKIKDLENKTEEYISSNKLQNNENSDIIDTSCDISKLGEDEKNNEIKKPYIFPSIELLNPNPNIGESSEDKNDLLKKAEKLESTLKSFGVIAKVLKVTKGPSVTRFELAPSPGVKVSKIVSLQDDIALGLASNGVRMEAPIPGKAAIGIEVPNKSQTPVFLRDLFESNEFQDSRANLAFAVGEDITGNCIVGDLSKMPHTLIAGATGSGKSVCINTLIVSLLYKYSPDDVKLLMVDPKVVELSVYNGIPHLLIPVVTDPKKAAGALNWAVNEMNRRYNLFSQLKVKNIDSYNSLSARDDSIEKMPYIVVIIDELADLMMTCPGDIEDYICRLAQMARAAGMHIIIATQRPSADVITGVIKANIPSRISFAVSSGIDSRTILDSVGAEKLLGRGDMLYYPSGESKPVRIQGAFISEEEVERVVEFIKTTEEETLYQQEILNHIDNNQISQGKTKNKSNENSEDMSGDDALIEEAIKTVVQYQQASTSFLQRKLRIGFNRASRLMDELEDKGVISKRDGNKPREILLREYNN